MGKSYLNKFLKQFLDSNLSINSSNWLKELDILMSNNKLCFKIVPFNEITMDIHFPFIIIDKGGKMGTIYSVNKGIAKIDIGDFIYQKVDVNSLKNINYALLILNVDYSIKRKRLEIRFNYTTFYFLISLLLACSILIQSISTIMICIFLSIYGLKGIYYNYLDTDKFGCKMSPFTDCQKSLGNLSPVFFYTLILMYILYIAIGLTLGFSGIIWWVFIFLSLIVSLILLVTNFIKPTKCLFCTSCNLIILFLCINITLDSYFSKGNFIFEFLALILSGLISKIVLYISIIIFRNNRIRKREKKAKIRINLFKYSNNFKIFNSLVLRYNGLAEIEDSIDKQYVFFDVSCKPCVESSILFAKKNKCLIVPVFFHHELNPERHFKSFEHFFIKENFYQNTTGEKNVDFSCYRESVFNLLDELQLNTFPFVLSKDGIKLLI